MDKLQERDKWIESARLSIVTENYVFCDCDEGCENCMDQEYCPVCGQVDNCGDCSHQEV